MTYVQGFTPVNGFIRSSHSSYLRLLSFLPLLFFFSSFLEEHRVVSTLHLSLSAFVCVCVDPLFVLSLFKSTKF